MTPAPNQRTHGGGEEYASEAERHLAEKNDETLGAMIRGIDDLERLRTWQRAASARGRTDVQRALTDRREELLDAADAEATEVGERA